MASTERNGLLPQAFLPVGRQIYPAGQVDTDARLTGAG